ncbi:MAG: type 1 glutamine amidotransferase [Actinomycetes bacterium]
MKPIVLVVQNEIDDPVALVGEWINEVGVEVEVVHAYRGETVPAVLPAHISGAIAMGGYMGANDDVEFPWLTDARSLMKDVIANDVPFFGICLGGQLLATAVDGVVEPTPVPEIGIASFRISHEAGRDAVFGKLAGQEVLAAEWHKDYITDLPDDVLVLAGNDVCPVQAFRIGQNVYGVQFHPEIDAEIFSSWAATDDELAKNKINLEQACKDVAAAQVQLISTWRPVFQAWAQLVKDYQGEKL